MLDHADRQLARLIAFLEQTDMLANTIVIVTSDNGASQEGGPLRFVNSAGPRNFRTEPFSEKLARASTRSAAPKHIRISHSAGLWRPTRRYGATSKTRTEAAFATRSFSAGSTELPPRLATGNSVSVAGERGLIDPA
jgi:arylsulfatase A-like enzyme